MTWSSIEAAVEGRPTDTGGRNPASQHPFLYYTMLAAPWGVAQSAALSLNHDQAASALRLVNLLFLLPLPMIVLATARVLGLDRSTGRLAAILLLGIPQLTHLVGLVNNDNALILIGALVTLLVARVLRDDASTGTSMALGGVLGLGLLVKGLALFWIPWLAAVYLWKLYQTRRRAFLFSGAAAGLAALIVGGWWWARNVIVYGQIQPRVLESPVSDPGPAETLAPWLRNFGIRFVDGFWGRFGTLDAPLPRPLTIGLWVVLSVLVVVGIGMSSRPRGDLDVPTSGRPVRLFLLAPFVMFSGLLVVNSLLTYLESSWAAGMQGRYLFPTVFGVVIVVALVIQRLGPVEEWVVLVGTLALQVMALFVMLDSWWGPRGGDVSLQGSLSSWAHWSPWQPEFIAVAVGVLCLIGLRGWRQDGHEKGSSAVMAGRHTDLGCDDETARGA